MTIHTRTHTNFGGEGGREIVILHRFSTKCLIMVTGNQSCTHGVKYINSTGDKHVNRCLMASTITFEQNTMTAEN